MWVVPHEAKRTGASAQHGASVLMGCATELGRCSGRLAGNAQGLEKKTQQIGFLCKQR